MYYEQIMEWIVMGFLFVLKDAPEIELEHLTLHTGVGFEAQLTCIVHAEPSPHVVWYKDTTQLGTTEQHSQLNRGNKYSLIIRNVTYNDLGNYTCQASNNLGKDRANLNLSGLPTVCAFDSIWTSNHQHNLLFDGVFDKDAFSGAGSSTKRSSTKTANYDKSTYINSSSIST